MPTASQSAKEKDRNKEKASLEDHQRLADEVSHLRQQLASLEETVRAMAERQTQQPACAASETPQSQQIVSPAHTNITSQRPGSPPQPQFTGPTRAAFSLNIVESSLNRMGMTSERVLAVPNTLDSSRAATPEPMTSSTLNLSAGGLQDILLDEIIRLLGIYQEEVACVHPIIETEDLILRVPEIMEFVSNTQPARVLTQVERKDAHILRIAVATAITDETHGRNGLSDRLISQVEQDISGISSETEVQLKDVQIMGMLSIYFCHTEEELFAWRAVGRACRQALEMGLHRKQSLLDNFKDAEERRLATKVFWTVYELDRRWSFGTSLSFAIHDHDIDTPLPNAQNSDHYFEHTVSYAKLCSRVWEALPSYGSIMQSIPKETEDYLDFITSNWSQATPKELQFRHPRLNPIPESQPRVLHRLRTLLYLRGNHVRILIHRHHVLTPESINADMLSAQLLVDIAKDSIHALVHLNETSDIYVRQQSVYHYYLLSALAVLLLAVCHAPSTFAEASRDSFVSAVNLVKDFSRHGTASRRLMKTLRGVLPFAKSFGLHADTESSGKEVTDSAAAGSQPQFLMTEASNTWWDRGDLNLEADMTSLPDPFSIGDGLITLYDAFGQADPATEGFGEQQLSDWVTRQFQGLM